MDETQRAQFADLPFVNGRLKAEVELIERLHKGQMGQLQAGPQVTCAPGIHFTTEHPVEELGIPALLFGRLLQQSLEPRFHRLESERGQRALHMLERRHWAPPAAALSYASSGRM
jgi:hypothetical protein